MAMTRFTLPRRLGGDQVVYGLLDIYVRCVQRALKISSDCARIDVAGALAKSSAFMGREMRLRMGPNEPAGVADEINRTGKGSSVAWSVPGTVLLIALWIGLVGGFLDLGLLILKHHLAGDRFFRLGDHFFWLIPAGDTVLIVVPGLFLALAGLVWRGAGFLRVAIGMLTFIGILNATARLPLAPWSVHIAVSGGGRSSCAVGRGRGASLQFVWLARAANHAASSGRLTQPHLDMVRRTSVV